jgi:hypothetical protein
MIRYRSTNDSVCRWAIFYLLGRVLSALRPRMGDLAALVSLAKPSSCVSGIGIMPLTFWQKDPTRKPKPK